MTAPDPDAALMAPRNVSGAVFTAWEDKLEN